MTVQASLQRELDVARMRSKLLREHYPRLQMGLSVSLSGLAGLGASFALLLAGVNSMGPRYFSNTAP